MCFQAGFSEVWFTVWSRCLRGRQSSSVRYGWMENDYNYKLLKLSHTISWNSHIYFSENFFEKVEHHWKSAKSRHSRTNTWLCDQGSPSLLIIGTENLTTVPNTGFDPSHDLDESFKQVSSTFCWRITMCSFLKCCCKCWDPLLIRRNLALSICWHLYRAPIAGSVCMVCSTFDSAAVKGIEALEMMQKLDSIPRGLPSRNSSPVPSWDERSLYFTWTKDA